MSINRSLTHLRLKLISVCSYLAIAFVGLSLLPSISCAENSAKESRNEKQVIGSTAVVEEVESDFSFPARVDTGATTSSLHVEDCKIKDEASKMTENVGKTIRFRIKNQRGESEWLERKIAEISVIKTSEQEERRYKVPITLNCSDVKKRVLVSLNDRSHMTYPVLLGRNFLEGDFLVDVALDKEQIEKDDPTARQKEDREAQSEKGVESAPKKK